jgi:hypothetical protein
MLMSPVIKAAMPEIAKATVAITIIATVPGPTPPSPVKTANNMESRVKAAARPTDQLPKELFGRILIRTYFTSCDI